MPQARITLINTATHVETEPEFVDLEDGTTHNDALALAEEMRDKRSTDEGTGYLVADVLWSRTEIEGTISHDPLGPGDNLSDEDRL